MQKQSKKNQKKQQQKQQKPLSSKALYITEKLQTHRLLAVALARVKQEIGGITLKDFASWIFLSFEREELEVIIKELNNYVAQRKSKTS